MWDGRETALPIRTREDLVFNLGGQSVSATLGHAQAVAPPTPEQIRQIVEFEMGLHAAQLIDNRAGSLYARGATGGPVALSAQEFYIGINDPLGGNPTGLAFNPVAMTLFSKWSNLSGPSTDVADFGDRVDSEIID